MVRFQENVKKEELKTGRKNKKEKNGQTKTKKKIKKNTVESIVACIKVGDSNQWWPEGSLFNSYYTDTKYPFNILKSSVSDAKMWEVYLSRVPSQEETILAISPWYENTEWRQQIQAYLCIQEHLTFHIHMVL